MVVVVEEIGAGVIGGGGDSLDIGQFLLPSGQIATPKDEAGATTDIVVRSAPQKLADDVVSASTERLMSTYVAPVSEVKNMVGNSGNSPSMNDLKIVTDILANGSCADVEQIVVATGLEKNVVVYCIEWLVQQGLVAQDASRYCGLSSVKRMCQQLKGCKECFSVL